MNNERIIIKLLNLFDLFCYMEVAVVH